MGSIGSMSNGDKGPFASVQSSPAMNSYSPRIEAIHEPVRPSDPSPMIKPYEPMRVNNPSPRKMSQDVIAPPMVRPVEPMRSQESFKGPPPMMRPMGPPPDPFQNPLFIQANTEYTQMK